VEEAEGQLGDGRKECSARCVAAAWTHALTRPRPRRTPSPACALLQLCSGQKDQIPQGQGIRINGEKYMHVQTLKAPTYQAKVRCRRFRRAGERGRRCVTILSHSGAVPLNPTLPSRLLPAALLHRLRSQIADADGNMASHPVTVDEVHVLKKGQYGVMLGVKGGYFFAARHDTKLNEQQGPAAAAAMAIGFYWAVGACRGRREGGGPA
jgi:hypothetical protein